MIEDIAKTKLYSFLKKRDSKFISQVDKVIEYANDILQHINNVFTNYTDHGIKHSINVMNYMYELITDIDELSELEVTILICSALLHDIGMVANDSEIKDIKADKLILGERKYSKVLEKYGEEKIALQECIRPVHAIRSKEHIDKHMNAELFLVPASTVISFQNELGLICMAHNEDFEWIGGNLLEESPKGEFDLNLQYIAVLLRISDYLDIDAQRAPLYLYKYLKPKEFSDLEWRQHFVIENYDKVRHSESMGIKEIVFHGSSKDPSVYRKLSKYFDDISGELKNAVRLCETYKKEKYSLPLRTDVVNNIHTSGFKFPDLRLSLNYAAVTNLLMGEHIYGNKKYGLRELIQNAIDACKTMEEIFLELEEFRYQKYQPFISIILDKDRRQVRIVDNGKGMSISILKNHFLNVGMSYYISDDYLFQGRTYSPIGHYGIGFLACFMLSERVEVNTRYYMDNTMNRISFKKNSEYICLTCEKTIRCPGTEIVLDYDQCLSAFSDSINHFVSFIEGNFLDLQIPIRISTMENGESKEIDCKLTKIEKCFSEGICLNQYLNGVEAYIECNYKQINFAKYLSDINGYDSFYYSEKDYSLIEEDGLSIKDCVKDEKIRMLNIPIISEDIESNFLKAYEFLEDYNEALDKIGSYDSINIWGNEDNIEIEEFLVDKSDDDIVGRYTLGEFREQFGHANKIPVHTFIVEKDVIINDSDLILPYKKNCLFPGNYSWDCTDRCYLKGIYLSELRLRIPSLIDGITLRGAVINITNPEFVPNVSRNNISNELQEKLSYAIGKALHMWIRDNVNFPPVEKNLLELFIQKEYREKNSCLK